MSNKKEETKTKSNAQPMNTQTMLDRIMNPIRQARKDAELPEIVLGKSAPKKVDAIEALRLKVNSTNGISKEYTQEDAIKGAIKEFGFTYKDDSEFEVEYTTDKKGKKIVKMDKDGKPVYKLDAKGKKIHIEKLDKNGKAHQAFNSHTATRTMRRIMTEADIKLCWEFVKDQSVGNKPRESNPVLKSLDEADAKKLNKTAQGLISKPKGAVNKIVEEVQKIVDAKGGTDATTEPKSDELKQFEAELEKEQKKKTPNQFVVMALQTQIAKLSKKTGTKTEPKPITAVSIMKMKTEEGSELNSFVALFKWIATQDADFKATKTEEAKA